VWKLAAAPYIARALPVGAQILRKLRHRTDLAEPTLPEKFRSDYEVLGVVLADFGPQFGPVAEAAADLASGAVLHGTGVAELATKASRLSLKDRLRYADALCDCCPDAILSCFPEFARPARAPQGGHETAGQVREGRAPRAPGGREGGQEPVRGRDEARQGSTASGARRARSQEGDSAIGGRAAARGPASGAGARPDVPPGDEGARGRVKSCRGGAEGGVAQGRAGPPRCCCYAALRRRSRFPVWCKHRLPRRAEQMASGQPADSEHGRRGHVRRDGGVDRAQKPPGPRGAR